MSKNKLTPKPIKEEVKEEVKKFIKTIEELSKKDKEQQADLEDAILLLEEYEDFKKIKYLASDIGGFSYERGGIHEEKKMKFNHLRQILKSKENLNRNIQTSLEKTSYFRKGRGAIGIEIKEQANELLQKILDSEEEDFYYSITNDHKNGKISDISTTEKIKS